MYQVLYMNVMTFPLLISIKWAPIILLSIAFFQIYFYAYFLKALRDEKKKFWVEIFSVN